MYGMLCDNTIETPRASTPRSEMALNRLQEIRTLHTELDAQVESALIGLLLIVFQISDATLTLTGIRFFGINAEGNALLRLMMHHWDPVTAIVLSKGLCISLILAVVLTVERVSWARYALAGLSAVYLTSAIIPWTYILTTRVA